MAPRNYKQEYKTSQSSLASKKARARRNKARRKAIRKGRVRKGDSKELDHKRANARGKTRVVSRRTNRRRGKPGRKKK